MSRRPSTQAAQKNFATLPSVNIQRSQFNRSHGVKTTFDAGELIPILCDEALPGDTINLNLTSFARTATPIFPLMDNMYIDTHFFAVPMRLLWDNWEKFNGAQDDPGDSVSFVIPQVSSAAFGFVEGSIGDYLGLPTTASAALSVSALFFRANNLIWNEWFRDENMQDSVAVNMGDGPDDLADYDIWKRGKRHDYFTSCLPWPQKGAAIALPLGTSAPIVSSGNGLPEWLIGGVTVSALEGNAVNQDVEWETQPLGAGTAVWDDPKLEVDLSAATSATINELRQAFQLQKMGEKDARGGTRYTELLRVHFGVVSDDARLQRPEYLGGGSMPINITQVEANTEGTSQVVGDLAGYGMAVSQSSSFTKSFTEHCIILGYVSLRADLNYQQGIDRQFSRSGRYDFFWPSLAQIGEQAVLNKEIYAIGGAADENVFGYQERYAEYRYKRGMITGKFRSDATGTLDPWHLAQEFTGRPVLNDTFITENPPMDRTIAVPSEPHVIFDGFFNIKHARPMPTYGIPGNIDRF